MTSCSVSNRLKAMCSKFTKNKELLVLHQHEINPYRHILTGKLVQRNEIETRLVRKLFRLHYWPAFKKETYKPKIIPPTFQPIIPFPLNFYPILGILPVALTAILIRNFDA